MPPRKKTAGEPAPATKPARSPRSTRKYIRNLYGTPLALKLDDGSRIELRPRGMRGDLAPLTKPQQEDGKLNLNIGIVIEVISEAEAKKVIEGQNTNQQAYHPALQIIRDPNGQQYAQQDVKVEADPQQAGETVAFLKDGQIVTERVPGKGQQMVRNPEGRSVGPRIATDVTGADPEFAELLQADDAARNGSSLEEILGVYEVDR